MTPEQRLKSRFESLINRSFPKGRFLLQKIETSTGVGIPDYYFSMDMSIEKPFNELKRDMSIEKPFNELKRDMSIEKPFNELKRDVNPIYRPELDAEQPTIECQNSCWIEAKTLDYKVDRFQCNWAHKHALAGGITLILTTLPPSVRLVSLPPYPTPCAPIVGTLQHITNGSAKKEGDLIMIPFDDRMLDFSTLGAYLRQVTSR